MIANGLAVTISDCTTYQNCTLAVFTGYSGSDRYDQTFNTAAQIHQINKYSATTLYNNLKSGVSVHIHLIYYKYSMYVHAREGSQNRGGENKGRVQSSSRASRC